MAARCTHVQGPPHTRYASPRTRAHLSCADGRAESEWGRGEHEAALHMHGPPTRGMQRQVRSRVCGRGSGCQGRGGPRMRLRGQQRLAESPSPHSAPSAGYRQRGVEPVLAAGESCLSAEGQRGTTGPHTLRRCGFCAPCAGPYEGAPWRPETSCRPAGPAGTQRRAS